MSKRLIILVVCLIVVAGAAWFFLNRPNSTDTESINTSQPNPEVSTNDSHPTPTSHPKLLDPHNKKILFIDSYHAGYEWSDGVVLGMQSVLKNTGVNVEIVHMDTKRNGQEDFQVRAGKKVKAAIEAFQPDVIIAADDNASKYVIQPYFKDADIPVVFCGVNWDASTYDYPYKNSTGMVEVEPIKPLAKQMKKYAKGNRIGFISNKGYTSEKVAKTYNDRFFDGKMKIYLAASFEEFKALFLQAQNEVDMLILHSYPGIKNWNSEKAEAFLLKNTRIPTGSTLDFMAPFVLFAFARIPEEQGEWAAEAAMKILSGTKPSDIPQATNKRFHLIINMKMAKKLGITFDSATLDMAEILR